MPVRNGAACLTALLLLLGAIAARPGVAAAQPDRRVVRIGFVLDGPWDRNEEILALMREEIRALVGVEFDVQFPDDRRLVADWTSDGAARALDDLIRDPNVDLVVALGILSSDRACRAGAPAKPVIAPVVIDAEIQQLPNRDGTSGVHNLTYLSVPSAVDRDLRAFRALVQFERLAVFSNEYIDRELPHLGERVRGATAGLGLDLRRVPVGTSAAQALSRLPTDTQAVYLLPLLQVSSASFDSLLTGLSERRLPSFSLLGEKEVRRGVLAGVSPDIFPQMARRLAVTVQRILAGTDPADIPTGLVVGEHLMINARTAQAIGWVPDWAGLAQAEVVGEAEPRGRPLTFVGAMREAIEANVDLAVAEQRVRTGHADVALARAPLLPQADATARALQIDSDRAAASFGSQPERSLSGTIEASQVLFAESEWARWSIEKSLQRGREHDLEQTRLDIAQTAGSAYLDVLRAQTLERIRTENLQLTRSHLETARMLEAVGTGGRSDVYRWESEIATNRKDAIDANARRNLAEIELNRILNRAPEEPFVANDTGLEDPEVVPSLRTSLEYFDDKTQFRVLRDFLAQEGDSTSPELQAIDAAVAAAHRELQSATRAFFLPRLDAQGSVGPLWSKSGAGSEPGLALPGLATANDNDWSIGVQASYPLLRGGGRLAARSRAREEVTRLEFERQAAAQRIEQRIRSAVHLAGASHAGIREARLAAEWAQRNLDLVTDAYSRGAASFIALLDAQNAHVVAEQSAANAVYNFLDDWLEVQRAMGHFDFMMSDDERSAFRERLRAFAAAAGVR